MHAPRRFASVSRVGRLSIVTTLALGALVVPLSACRDRKTEALAERPVDAGDALGTHPNASSDAPDAAAAPRVPTSADGSVDLLHATASAVAVSSNVNNPRDFPEHLVDGNPRTAWNGRTGDLVGAWVKVRVPATARIERIEMSIGFDKTNREGDLFTMNHRIKRVRVFRGEVAVGDHTFDIGERGLQSIRVGAGGGTYRIEVLETVPGTQPSWKELCISELRVMGDPGRAALTANAMPLVGVGLLPYEMAAWPPDELGKATQSLLTRGWPTAADFCRAWSAKVGPSLAKRRADGETMVPDGAHCTVKGALFPAFVGGAKIKGLRKIEVDAVNWTEDRFVIETDTGAFVPDMQPLDTHPYNDPGCFGGNVVTIVSAATDRDGGPGLAIEIEDTYTNSRQWEDEDGGIVSTYSDDISRARIDCTPEGGHWACTRKVLSRVCHGGQDVVPCDSF